uniref:uncharacterized protein n=1 Tax=Myxine glutinosa TaxID=7769 RepID=UPI00358FBCE0
MGSLHAKRKQRAESQSAKTEGPVTAEKVVQVEPSQVQVEPSQVQVEPSQVQVEPSQVQVEPSQVQVELSQIQVSGDSDTLTRTNRHAELVENLPKKRNFKSTKLRLSLRERTPADLENIIANSSSSTRPIRSSSMSASTDCSRHQINEGEVQDGDAVQLGRKRILHPALSLRSHQELRKELVFCKEQGLLLSPRPELFKVMQQRRKDQHFWPRRAVSMMEGQLLWKYKGKHQQSSIAPDENASAEGDENIPEFVKVKSRLRPASMRVQVDSCVH